MLAAPIKSENARHFIFHIGHMLRDNVLKLFKLLEWEEKICELARQSQVLKWTAKTNQPFLLIIDIEWCTDIVTSFMFSLVQTQPTSVQLLQVISWVTIVYAQPLKHCPGTKPRSNRSVPCLTYSGSQRTHSNETCQLTRRSQRRRYVLSTVVSVPQNSCMRRLCFPSPGSACTADFSRLAHDFCNNEEREHAEIQQDTEVTWGALSNLPMRMCRIRELYKQHCETAKTHTAHTKDKYKDRE